MDQWFLKNVSETLGTLLPTSSFQKFRDYFPYTTLLNHFSINPLTHMEKGTETPSGVAQILGGLQDIIHNNRKCFKTLLFIMRASLVAQW